MGTGLADATKGVLTKGCQNSPQEKHVLFQLSDILSVKGNYIPSMLLDQFSIQLGLTLSQGGIIVPSKFDADMGNDTLNPKNYHIVLDQVELFIYYYPCSLDDVRAIRFAAQTLERDGVSSYGMSFLTK